MKDSLISEIESAWAGAVPPDPSNISMPTYDDEGTAVYFRGKTWRGHSAAQLRKLDFSLFIFTPEAFVYFLPAYMIGHIQDPKTSDINSDNLMFALSPSQGSDAERTAKILSLLSRAQKLAVRHFFEYVRAEEGDWTPRDYSEVLSIGS